MENLPVTRDYIEKEIESRIQAYIASPKYIESDRNREKANMQSYRGREILELLQNADDELPERNSPEKREVRIDFHDNILRISNYGSPFDQDGISSIMYSDTSKKSKRKKAVIGNKGTGFRSILGWAEEVAIDSADMHVRFNAEHSQNVLNSLKGKISNEAIEEGPAILAFPEWNEEHIHSDYTTVISIRTRDSADIRNDIEEQLKSIDENVLLFLNRTGVLCIETDDISYRYEKNVTTVNQVESIAYLFRYVNGEKVSLQEWILKKHEGVIAENSTEKNYSVVLAYNKSPDANYRHVVYSYFATEIDYPFPFLLHADFRLDQNRNHLIKKDKSNEIMLRYAAALMVDTAKSVYPAATSYGALELLIRKRKLPEDLASYNFDDILLATLKTAYILPNVNNKYLSAKDKPAYYPDGLTKYLTGKSFGNCLLYTDDGNVKSMISRILEGRSNRYLYKDICILISKWISRRDLDNKLHIRHMVYEAYAFISEYGSNITSEQGRELCPSFFKNQLGKLVPATQPIFFSHEDIDVTQPPKFVNIHFLDSYTREYMRKFLSSECGYDNDDDIVNAFEVLNIREYSQEELLEAVNNGIERNIKNRSRSLKKHWEDALIWMWQNREALVGNHISLLCPNRVGKYVKSDTLYSGQEYGNQLCEKLLSQTFPEKLIGDIAPYLPLNTDIEEINDFLLFLRVSKLPRIKVEDYSINNYSYLPPTERERHNLAEQYKRQILLQLPFPFKIENDTMPTCENLLRRITFVAGRRSSIDELGRILSTCKTEYILEWIRADNDLYKIVTTGNELQSMPLSLMWGQKLKPRSITDIKLQYSFIYHLFKYYPWIEVAGRRYKIDECLLNADATICLSRYLAYPDVTEYIKNVEGKRTVLKREYITLLKDIGVKESIADLPIEKIYEILKGLPETECTDTTVKNIYRSLVESKRDFTLGKIECTERSDFLKNGKVLCNTGYKGISEAFYLATKCLSSKVSSMYNLLCLPTRCNSGKVYNLFGVNRLSIEAKLIGEPTVCECNAAFTEAFHKFLPMAFTYRVSEHIGDIKSEARKLSLLSVSICTEITADFSGTTSDLDDYEYIQAELGNYYIKVPNGFTLKRLNENPRMADAIANIVCSYLDISSLSDKIRMLYLVGSTKIREEQLRVDFDDLQTYREAKELMNFDEDARDEFIRIVASITEKSEADIEKLSADIDFEDISSIANCLPIIKLFNTLEIDVAEYNGENPVTEINLIPYLEDAVQIERFQLEDKYKATRFAELEKSTIEEKMKLARRFIEYSNIPIRIENSVRFNPEEAVIRQLLIDIFTESVNFNALFQKNRSKLRSLIEDTAYFEEFLEKDENHSLVYFGEFEELIKRFYSYQSEQREAERIAAEESNLKEPSLSVVVNYEVSPGDYHASRKGLPQKTGFSQPSKNEQLKTGLVGERLVYKKLIASQSYRVVKWVSENAKKDNVNPEGRAGTGYDIELLDVNGKRSFVEVKSSKEPLTDGVRFYLSDNEAAFGAEHEDSYIIYYVGAVFSDCPQLLILGDVFQEGQINSERYLVESKFEYKLSAIVTSDSP